MKQEMRRIDWARDDTATVVRKIHAADGAPGVFDELFGVPCYLFDAHAISHPNPSPRGRGDLDPSACGRGTEGAGESAAPSTVFARNGDGVLRATRDGAVRIGHCKRADIEDAFKLPVALAFPEQHATLSDDATDFSDIRYDEHGDVGVLHFAFYNGAMSTAQCQRLLTAYRDALDRPTRAIVLAGGPDFFSNGIHLNVIEAAASPADESMRNIEAIDDVCRAIIETSDRITIAALQGNAGAGGCFLAFACDKVWARSGVLLNPHYKNMGNLYGSEYWTYTLPRRVQHGAPRAVMENRLPISAAQAVAIGLVDSVIDIGRPAFMDAITARALELVSDASHAPCVAAKRERRARDEADRPLAKYREEELARMRRNFHGFDPSYHYARSHFVRKVPHAWTPRHLAIHRDMPRSGRT
jgi:putative two-component system hydrogenase maturation factor HypX/HoxX